MNNNLDKCTGRRMKLIDKIKIKSMNFISKHSFISYIFLITFILFGGILRVF